MVHLALLRGINVGGANRLPMADLRRIVAACGHADVQTLIASGNVVFTTRRRDRAALAAEIEQAIRADTGLEVPVLLRSHDQVRAVAAAIPDGWANDGRQRCDVLFVWDDVDPEAVLGDLPARDGVDEVRAAPGAIIWSVDRARINASGLRRIVGTPLYRRLTIRNATTVRRLRDMMDAAAA